jgi:aspartyl-tRNA(Asn)/glutamyl-tRNA(Gln) amidotransferase subunit A
MGSSTENSGFFPTHNPWNPECVPGGSSGGSAAAVAAGMVPVALGSDTGGSIRQPAALCGVVGLKPTYGRVSRYGLVAYGSSLDQIGTLSGCVEDAALSLSAIAGRDPHDSTSVDQPVPGYRAALADEKLRDLAGRLRIGVPREYFGEGLDDETRAAVQAALDLYRRLGATLVDISLPHSPYAVATYYLVATAEASSNLARYDGVHYGHRTPHPKDIIDLYNSSRSEGFGAEVKRRIMLGTFALSAGYYDAYYSRALKVRRLIKQDFDRAFEQCDIIAGPTAPAPAFRLGEKLASPLAMYLADIYTIAVNLAGIPGISLPCGFSRTGLPIGLQLMAPLFGEEPLLQAARLYERETEWHTARPAV